MGIILVVGGVKGGIGKSTISSNLAVCAADDGLNVMLIDADSSDQQTTLRWAEVRNGNPRVTLQITTMALHGASIRAELFRLADAYDLVIVDPGARDTNIQRLALSAADLVVLPFPPRGPDLWTLDAVTAMLAHVREINPGLRALAIVNRADSRGENNHEAEAEFKRYADSIESPGVRVGNRISIHNAHLSGLGAIEMSRPDQKAINELKDLYKQVLEAIRKGVKEHEQQL